MQKTVCELFAGVGGFRIGLENADTDWNTVWANQWEPGRKRQDAFDCYCTHFGRKDIYVNEDIGTIDKAAIPDHTLLVGGFPCQDYSVAHTGAQGIEGRKGVLWWQIRDTLMAKHPPFVLLENVDRLLKSPGRQRGRDFGIILASFWNLGYSVEWRVVNAADYGFVQRRRRTFIFAYRNDTAYGQRMRGCKPLDVLNTAGFFARAFPMVPCESIHRGVLGTQNLLEISDKFAFPFDSAGCMSDGIIATTKAEPDYHGPHKFLKDIMDHDVDKKYYLDREALEKFRYLKGAKRIERTATTGHRYTFSEGPIAFPDPSDRPARTMLTSEGTTNRSTHVVKDLDTGRLRLLTPNEADKIQGFPEHWTDTGMSERMQYFCMGNALVAGCITQMAVVLGKIIDDE